MHIILGLLGTIVTILILLKRLAQAGIDLGGLNPFLWRRRRNWRYAIEGNPIFSLEDPKEIAALLVVGVAKVDGVLSAEEKQALHQEFQGTFAFSSREAASLLASSVHMLGDAGVLREQSANVLKGSRDKFSPEQTASLLAMMDRIASTDGAPSEQQQKLLNAVRTELAPPPVSEGPSWGA